MSSIGLFSRFLAGGVDMEFGLRTLSRERSGDPRHFRFLQAAARSVKEARGVPSCQESQELM
jgi:hypothetical protein